ncbi:hypothetical protein D3C71_182170 [compost metagenome]
MSGAGAFRNDEAVKARALDDAAAGAHRGWATDATDADRQACAEAFGLTVGLVTLLSMSSRAPYLDGSCAFLRDALDDIRPGADLDRLLRRWMASVWTDPDYGIEGRLPGGAARDAAQAVVDLVRRSMGAPVARPEWRAARNALLAAMKDVPPAPAAFARVAAAMAWDLDAMPGVASDVWLAWDRAYEEEMGLAAGWPKSVQDEVTESYRACMREGYGAAPALAENAGEAAREAHEAAVRAATDRALEASGQGERWKALTAYWQSGVVENMGAWREHALGTIRAEARVEERVAA